MYHQKLHHNPRLCWNCTIKYNNACESLNLFNFLLVWLLQWSCTSNQDVCIGLWIKCGHTVWLIQEKYACTLTVYTISNILLGIFWQIICRISHDTQNVIYIHKTNLHLICFLSWRAIHFNIILLSWEGENRIL